MILFSSESAVNTINHNTGIDGDFKKPFICFKNGMQEKNTRTSTTPETVHSALFSIHIGNWLKVATKGAEMSMPRANALSNRPFVTSRINNHAFAIVYECVCFLRKLCALCPFKSYKILDALREHFIICRYRGEYLHHGRILQNLLIH